MSSCIEAHEVMRTGRYHPSGYWMMHNSAKRRVDYAHRMVYLECFGKMDGPIVRHTCDNRKCVNPAHLVTGTKADNTRDMVLRGRSLAQLDRDQLYVVRHLLSEGWSAPRIARTLSISVHSIKNLKRGRSYQHV